MNYKLSKLARTIIIINVILTIIMIGFHGYNVYRMQESYDKIEEVMLEKKVIKETAVRMLEKEGVSLYIDKEFTAYFGLFMSILTLILLRKFAKENGFFYGFFVSFTSIFTSLIGGLLLFYVIFSGKSQIGGNGNSHSLKDEWERYIHKRSDFTDDSEN